MKHGYKWEQNTNRSWESVQEDGKGNIKIGIGDSIELERAKSQRAKQSRITQSIRRGLIRFTILAIDSSRSSGELDHAYKPYGSRIEAMKASACKFVTNFYDQNPISSLGVIVTKDRIAERLTELSGNPKAHVARIQDLKHGTSAASLQNTLWLSMQMLQHVPEYGYRELIILYSSLSTCDPGDIFQTVEEAKNFNIRVSVICLQAEVYVCKQLAALTNGTFSIALDCKHLEELLNKQLIPSPVLKDTIKSSYADFVYMGFPKRVFDSNASFCYDGNRPRLSKTAYICPRCCTRTLVIPTKCCVCHLQLNSSSHIARSHHHLFPVLNFEEYTVIKEEAKPLETYNNGSSLKAEKVKVEPPIYMVQISLGNDEYKNEPIEFCAGCLENLQVEDRLVLRCINCEKIFCVDCDLFIHDSLHNCPDCL